MSIFTMVLFIELGYWIAQRPHGKTNKAQLAQVRAIMGASLGLLAFMLAFSFSMAQQHFELRTDAYMLEITAVDSAYRGADLLEPDSQRAAKEKLREFVDLRRELSILSFKDFAGVAERIRAAEKIHDRLWRIAESAMALEGDSVDAGIFASAILEMIRANDERLQSTLFNRISPIIWITLYLMSLLSMLIMGFQAGLTGSRSRLATWTLAITFSAVMMLVTDLDRPRMSLFKMNQQLMIELQNRMNQQPPDSDMQATDN
jgi:hypothetical protein